MNRTTGIATVTVPVVGGWTCSKCGAPNASEGKMVSTSSSVRYSTSRDAREAAKKDALAKAKKDWVLNIFGLIVRGSKDYVPYYSDMIHVDDCKCCDCEHREIWSYNNIETPLHLFCIPLPMLVIIFAIIDLTDKNTPSWRAILAIGIALLFIIAGFVVEDQFKKRFFALPKTSVPVFITMNEDVLDYAQSLGIDLLAEERAEPVYRGLEYKEQRKNGVTVQNKIERQQADVDVHQKAELTASPAVFPADKHCPSCGQRVPQDSVFCPFCGTKISGLSESTKANKPSPVNSQTYETSPQKSKKKTGLIISIIVAVLLIGGTIAYFVSYSSAKSFAQQGNCSEANKYLIMPSITKMHDPDIVNYVSAGLEFDKGNYETAVALYKECAANNYLDSDKKLADSKIKYFDSIADSIIRKYEISDVYGIEYVNELKAQNKIEEKDIDLFNSVLYEKALKWFCDGDKDKARQLFAFLGSYEDSSKYYKLIQNDSIKDLFDLLPEEEASQIILDHYMFEFLTGRWKTDSKDYFSLIKNTDGTYTSNTSLPEPKNAGNIFGIVDGRYYLYKDENDLNGQLAYSFTILGKNKIKILCNSNLKTVTMSRSTALSDFAKIGSGHA